MSTGISGTGDEIRPVRYVGDSLKVISAMPVDCQDEIGVALRHAQVGMRGYKVKVLQGFGGASVLQITSSSREGTFRVVYTVRFPQAVFVLHAFQKKSKSGRATPAEDMDRVRRRLQQAEADYAEFYPESS